ncbi:MAG: hypothetical protein AAFX03_07570 [Pseudomonadota bacterium]
MKGMFRLSDWQIGALAAVALVSVAAVMAFNGGVDLEAGGLHISLNASKEAGLRVVFYAAT